MIQYTKKKRVGKGRFLRISGSRFLLMWKQREGQVDRKQPQKKREPKLSFKTNVLPKPADASFPPTASIFAVPLVFPVIHKSASVGIDGPIGQDTGISVDKKNNNFFIRPLLPNLISSDYGLLRITADICRNFKTNPDRLSFHNENYFSPEMVTSTSSCRLM